MATYKRMTVAQAFAKTGASNSAELAKLLGTSRQLVDHWKTKGIPHWWAVSVNLIRKRK